MPVPYSGVVDSVITLLLCVLAAARLTQLIHADRIMLWFRVAITKWVAARHAPQIGVHGAARKKITEDPEMLAELLTRRNGKAPMPLYWLICTWCISIAAAAGPAAVWVWWAHHPFARFTVALLAFSLLTVYLREGWLIMGGKRAMYTSVPQAEPSREEAHT